MLDEVLAMLQEVLAMLEEVLAMLEEVLAMLEEVLGKAFALVPVGLGEICGSFFVFFVASSSSSGRGA